jgi:hypothetical protein
LTSQTEAQNFSTVTAALVQKAILEPAFRAELLANPKATVEKALNNKLPSTLNLKVIEATQTEYTVVLPYQSQIGAAGELSDSDLETVAGGSKSGATNFGDGLLKGLTGQPDSGGGTNGTWGNIMGQTIILGAKQ